MVIRPAIPDDLIAMIDMGAQFYATTAYAQFADYHVGSAYALLEMLLEHGVLLVADDGGEVVGMVGLIVSPFPFNLAVKTAHEVMWWVNPEARATGAGHALLRAVEPACREAGVVAIQMIHLANSPPQAAILYGRAGYDHSETSYIKAL
jgi:GNAT superfamily N-acetyltransferase